MRVKYWHGIVVSAVIAAGCSGTLQVARTEADIPEGEALLLFAVDLEGGAGPVCIGFDPEPFLDMGLFRTDLVLRRGCDAEPGEARLGQLVAVPVPPSPLRIGVVRVGDYGEFAGGRLEQELIPRGGMAYYLGTVVISYEEEESIVVTDYYDDGAVVRTLPRSPGDAPPRTRYLLASIKIINDEPQAQFLLQKQFGMAKEQLENRTRFWDRMRSGGFLRERQARPVEVKTLKRPSTAAPEKAS